MGTSKINSEMLVGPTGEFERNLQKAKTFRRLMDLRQENPAEFVKGFDRARRLNNSVNDRQNPEEIGMGEERARELRESINKEE